VYRTIFSDKTEIKGVFHVRTLFGKHLHWALVAGGISILGAVIAVIPDNAEANRSTEVAHAQNSLPVTNNSPLALSLPNKANTENTELTEKLQPLGEWHTVAVNSGDSLARLFSRQGLSAQEVHKATDSDIAATRLKKIFPGDELKLRIHEKQLTELVYDFDIGQSLHLTRNGEAFVTQIIDKPLETRITQTNAVINDSLFLSAQSAGLSDKLTMELAGIFGWDVDFALDIRQGDSFTVMYEEIFLDGEKVRDGKIIAAEFINRDNAYQAIHYTDSEGHGDYYTPEGRSMRKAFLRSPVAFSRISSRFNLQRKHPVLNKIRAHKGVDYAASRGTPIKATGDGRIVHRGNKGGYGRTVVVQHGSRYNTLYAHMSNYARGLKSGSRVKQGQIIGYVGSSGLATGPHLHYEFRIDGVHRNPLTARLPSAQPLSKKHIAGFKTKSNQMLARLNLIKRTQLALADTQ